MCLFHRTDLVTLVIQIQNAVALICEPAVALFALWGCGQFKAKLPPPKVRARRQQQRRPARHASQALKAALTGTGAVSWRPH